MKKHIIIGKPINHSLSPKLHEFWFKQHNINAEYIKLEPNENELENILNKIKTNEIFGMNVTVPFKQSVLKFLDDKSDIVKQTNSVNTIYNKNGIIFGDNTDVYGFKQSLIKHRINLKKKTVMILGAGGVVPSLVCALLDMKVNKIFISNRTEEKAKSLSQNYPNVEVIQWGKLENFDMYINATSLGLKDTDKIEFNYKKLNEKKIFYDIIYNPLKTNFLKEAEKLNHLILNGRDMFLYQGQKAFNLWHNIMPKVDDELLRYLYND